MNEVNVNQRCDMSIKYTDSQWASVETLYTAMKEGLPTDWYSLMELDRHARAVWVCLEEQGLEDLIHEPDAEGWHDTEMSDINDLCGYMMSPVYHSVRVLEAVLAEMDREGTDVLYMDLGHEDAFTVYRVYTERGLREMMDTCWDGDGDRATWERSFMAQMWDDEHEGEDRLAEAEACGEYPWGGVPQIHRADVELALDVHSRARCKATWDVYSFQILHDYLRDSKSAGWARRA